MAAPEGNKFWEKRSKHGRDHKYTPEELWEEALSYFKWCEDNPLYEDTVHVYKGEATHERAAKMRAMTIGGFCLHLGIGSTTYDNYRNNNDFVGITGRIDETIRLQKFAGAAAGLLNANIIARDLGLRDESKTVLSADESMKEALKPFKILK